MRKRHQKGSLKIVGTAWIGQWWEPSHGGKRKRRTKTLGHIPGVTEAVARARLDAILAPINARVEPGTRVRGFTGFIERTFFPFARRKWKKSTAKTTEYRVRHHLCKALGERLLETIERQSLQDLLDAKAADGHAHSVVAHLRWDLSQIFEFAVAEQLVERNPAKLLYVPRDAVRPDKPKMSKDQIPLLLSILSPREQLIVSLAVIAGVRPGEILALQWKHVKLYALKIRQRVYLGEIDTPKTEYAVRDVALTEGLRERLSQWCSEAVDTRPEAWVFPSERSTPLSRDNVLRDHIQEPAKTVGLEWVNFLVLRRTHNSLMRELEIDPKLVADQCGHTVDVNLNVYTTTGVTQRAAAVNQLEQLLQNLNGTKVPATIQ